MATGRRAHARKGTAGVRAHTVRDRRHPSWDLHTNEMLFRWAADMERARAPMPDDLSATGAEIAAGEYATRRRDMVRLAQRGKLPAPIIVILPSEALAERGG